MFDHTGHQQVVDLILTCLISQDGSQSRFDHGFFLARVEVGVDSLAGGYVDSGNGMQFIGYSLEVHCFILEETFVLAGKVSFEICVGNRFN